MSEVTQNDNVEFPEHEIISRKVELIPKFELNSPKFSKEFVMAFLDMDEARYSDADIKSIIQENKKRMEMLFEGEDESDENLLKKVLENKIDQQLNYPGISKDEKKLLLEDRKQLELAATKVESWRDSLTGLYNRTGLVEILKLVLKDPKAIYKDEANTLSKNIQNTNFSIMLLDIDDLKQINDGPGGHAEGDRVIRGVATAIKASVRPGDVVARIGGDEFVVIAIGANEEE